MLYQVTCKVEQSVTDKKDGRELRASTETLCGFVMAENASQAIYRAKACIMEQNSDTFHIEVLDVVARSASMESKGFFVNFCLP